MVDGKCRYMKTVSSNPFHLTKLQSYFHNDVIQNIFPVI